MKKMFMIFEEDQCHYSESSKILKDTTVIRLLLMGGFIKTSLLITNINVLWWILLFTLSSTFT